MKTTLILLCLILCGCAMIEHTDKDGNKTVYIRVGDQAIGTGSIDLPGGGKLNFEGQESKLPKVEITATSITIGGKKEKP